MNLQRKNSNHQVIVTGTGRSGTTALMQLFTKLGLDTGYSEEDIFNTDTVSQAGLEDAMLFKDRPYILKTPWLMYTIENVLRSGIVIDCAIIPIRDIAQVEASRHRVYQHHLENGHEKPETTPGSLMPPEGHGSQQAALALRQHHLLRCLAEHEVPVLFVSFPSFVTDWTHCYRSLKPVFDGFGCDEHSVQQAHQAVLNPELVHNFNKEK